MKLLVISVYCVTAEEGRRKTAVDLPVIVVIDCCCGDRDGIRSSEGRRSDASWVDYSIAFAGGIRRRTSAMGSEIGEILP